MPQAQLDAIVWQVEQWQTRYDIPDENVIRHADINQIDKEFCPGDVLYNRVMGIISGQVRWSRSRTLYSGAAAAVRRLRQDDQR